MANTDSQEIQAVTLENYVSRIEGIAHSGTSDKVTIAYMQGLLTRAQQTRPEVRQAILNKLDQQLGQYDSSNSPSTDGDDVEPETMGEVEQASPSLLQGLVQYLESHSLDDVLDNEDDRLQSHLEEQEQGLLATWLKPEVEQTPITGKGGNQPETLRSVKRFKNTWKKNSVQKRLSFAVDSMPDNPGPLNPQLLATRALEKLQELSPEYLDRYLVYIDTLFWLEKTKEQQEKLNKRKKSAARSFSKQ